VAKTFDPNFYIVCATVIPVLFLAAAVQGSSYKTILDTALKVRVTHAGDGWARKFVARSRARVLVYIAYFIWAAGACGEIVALLVLYWGQEQPYDRQIVLLCTIFLVFAASAGPLDAFVRVRAKLDKWQDPRPEIERSVSSASDSPAITDDGGDDEFTSDGLGWPDKKLFRDHCSKGLRQATYERDGIQVQRGPRDRRGDILSPRKARDEAPTSQARGPQPAASMRCTVRGYQRAPFLAGTPSASMIAATSRSDLPSARSSRTRVMTASSASSGTNSPSSTRLP
jgi:hypothetical protein